MLRWSLPLLALLAGCAATPQDVARSDAMRAEEDVRLARALAGRAAGTPQSCLNTRNLNTSVFGDRILYRGVGDTVYLNQTNGGCFGLRRDDIIVASTPIGQFCRGDIIRTVDRASGAPSGACAFGDFVPYARAPRR
jgi:hypothetical protein